MTADFSTGGGSAPYIALSAGGAGAVGTGAYTIVALFKINANTGLAGAFTSGTAQRSFLVDTGHLYGHDDFTGGFGSLTNGTWYVAAESKPAGSNPYRMHLWPYAADGSGTMSHGTATSPGNHADGSAVDELRIGTAEVRANCVIAAVGFWDRVLSDAELDGLRSPNLSTWAALSPKALISLQNWNGTTGAVDVKGSSTQTGLVGTVTVGADPPSFNYAVANVVTAGNVTLAGDGALAAAGRRLGLGVAALAGDGQLAAASTRIAAAAAQLAADGALVDLSAPAHVIAAGALAFLADGQLAADGRRIARGAVDLSATGSLTIAANRAAGTPRRTAPPAPRRSSSGTARRTAAGTERRS